VTGMNTLNRKVFHQPNKEKVGIEMEEGKE
jgi:hypothetical protein